MQRLFLLLCFCSTFSYGQKTEKYYDYAWKEVPLKMARFLAIIERTDSGWSQRDYFLRERKLQMTGLYEDDSCKIEHGSFHYYHPGGTVSGAGKYVHGKRDGLWLHYYDNGIIRDSGHFEEGNPEGVHMSWHRNGYPADSSIWASGTGMEISWFDNGNVSSTGRYSGGKKKGLWQYFHRNGNLSATERYVDGKISRQLYDEAGNIIADTSSRDHKASFHSGPEGWSKYLRRNLFYPKNLELFYTDKAIVVISFIIDEAGKVKDAEVAVPFHPEFDNMALEVVKKSPAWIPAVEHNRKVTSRQQMEVAFLE